MDLPWLSPARKVFDRFVEAGRLPHAILLSGPSGCGKKQFADSICRELLCADNACGSCRSCQLFESGAHPDYRDITFEDHPRTGKLRTVITVDQLRTLVEFVTKTTTISERKVALIHPAEGMNANAANALLKTLEEPAGNSVLLLMANHPEQLPITIRSRCQGIEVRLPPGNEARAWLQQQSGADGSAAALALEASAGKPLEALNLIVSDGIGSFQSCMEMLDGVRRGTVDASKVFAIIAELDIQQVWTWLSLRTVKALRNVAGEPGRQALARKLTELQRSADRNRRLAATPVRDDLLLREWLLQWQNLSADS